MKKRLFIIFLSTLIVLSGCTLQREEILVSETTDLQDFSKIYFNGIGSLTISQGNVNSLTIVAEPHILENITHQVIDETLVIDNRNTLSAAALNPNSSLQFHLIAKEISVIDINGSGVMSAAGFSGDYLVLNIFSVGRIKLDNVRYIGLDLNHFGGGTVEITGTIEEQNITLSGAVTYHSPDVQSEKVSVKMSGNSTATVWAMVSLDADIEQNSNLFYYGFPETTFVGDSGLYITNLGPK